MKHLLKSLFVLAAFALMGIVPAFAAYNMQDYYPLSQGNSWTYFETEGGETEICAETYTKIVSGTEDVDGVSTMKVGEWISSQDYWYDNLAWDAEGLKKYYEVWSGETEPKIGEGRFLTPVVCLPTLMEIGVPISHSVSVEWYENGELEGYEEGTLTHTLEDIEKITVEAGTFEECLKIHKELTTTWYDRQGGTAQVSLIEDHYLWLAPGIGVIKEIWTETLYDIAGEMVETADTGIKELRWATINVGAGVQLWNGIDFSGAGATFNETTMYLHDVYIGDTEYHGLAFRLDLHDNIFYAFEPEGYGPVSVSGLDFSNAYIKMNGDSLTIYNIDILGTKYWTQWRLVIEPSVGFLFVDYGLMQ